jgi:opacity protein-like surface antigen
MLPLTDSVTNDYFSTKHDGINPIIGAGVFGHPFSELDGKPLDLSIGLTYYNVQFSAINGVEYPFANAGTFDTLNYSLKEHANALMLEPKLIYKRYQHWQPYIITGVGASWNRMNSYAETPTNPNGSAAALPQTFGGYTNSDFAYEAGIGIQCPIRSRYAIALDYRYMNLGSGKLNNFPTETVSNRFVVQNLYTNALLLTLEATI